MLDLILVLLKIFPVVNSIINKDTEMLDIYINIYHSISIYIVSDFGAPFNGRGQVRGQLQSPRPA